MNVTEMTGTLEAALWEIAAIEDAQWNLKRV
jgi:hypothetical protein